MAADHIKKQHRGDAMHLHSHMGKDKFAHNSKTAGTQHEECMREPLKGMVAPPEGYQGNMDQENEDSD